jgi:hypothetical protein
MSLDVTLTAIAALTTCERCGAEHTCTREVFDWSGLTHNLTAMAGAAGIYAHIWRPEELGITKAGALAGPLRTGLDKLLAQPDIYKLHNPPNGWGDYDGFVEFVGKYLAACEEHPNAIIEVSR